MVDAIRALKDANLLNLKELDENCFDRPWPLEQLVEELRHRDAVALGYFTDEKLVGAILCRQTGDEFWVLRIMVHPKNRRLGLASVLLNHGVKGRAAKSLWLEVSTKNTSAIQFYRLEGFKEAGKRPGYYPASIPGREPEDALVMTRSMPIQLDYELLDSGSGFKYERFGKNRVIRSDEEAKWPPQAPPAKWEAEAMYYPNAQGANIWEKQSSFSEPWNVQAGNMCFNLRLSQSKNVGIFPEQGANWNWLANTISQCGYRPKVLNLFAYTGAATLAAADAGAEVCHVDAARSAIDRANKNQQLSKMSEKPIRWIIDDAQKFLNREVKRNKFYHGIILDPPPFGRAEKVQFLFKTEVLKLLKLCKQVLEPKPLFVLFNCYAVGLTPEQARDLLQEVFPKQKISAGRLTVTETERGYLLPCSVYARFRI